MIHLHALAEGLTELNYFNRVLAPHLWKTCGIIATCTSIGGVGNPPKYKFVKRALEMRIRQDRQRADVWYTTMIDLYAFPRDANSPFTPAIQAVADKYQKVAQLELSMSNALGHPRFIPYVQLHEFETFLMVDPSGLLFAFPDKERAIRQLKDSIAGLEPELINERPTHAPSKRIIAHVEEYGDLKATIGPQVADIIGLPALRDACPHFNEWLTRLEQLGTQ